jgi:hypothetical protein
MFEWQKGREFLSRGLRLARKKKTPMKLEIASGTLSIVRPKYLRNRRAADILTATLRLVSEGRLLGGRDAQKHDVEPCTCGGDWTVVDRM